MLALSIRQPFAELILRGIKTIEYRSRATRIIGQRFHIYVPKQATKRRSDGATKGIWSGDVGPADVPPWMIELADALRLFPHELPTGVIVGSAVIEKVTPVHRSSFILHPYYQWHLTDVQRATRLRKPRGHPQPVWFRI